MNFYEFKQKYKNTSCDYDGKYGYQCVDLAKLWVDKGWGLKPSSVGYDGGAKNIIIYPDSMLSSKLVQRIKYSQNKSVPLQGAIIIFDIAKTGHVAIVESANLNSVTVFEQNAVSTNVKYGTQDGDGKGEKYH